MSEPQQLPGQQPSHLKQRIIGAVILVAVVVIFAPMLLQKSLPDSDTVINLAQRPKIEQPSFPNKQNFVNAAQPAASDTSARVAQAWVVQLGSFTQKRNAEELVERLRTYGFTSYLYEMKNDKQKTIRVYVGPEVKKTQAQQLQQELQQKMALKGQVVPFNPLNS